MVKQNSDITATGVPKAIPPASEGCCDPKIPWGYTSVDPAFHERPTQRSAEGFEPWSCDIWYLYIVILIYFMNMLISYVVLIIYSNWFWGDSIVTWPTYQSCDVASGKCLTLCELENGHLERIFPWTWTFIVDLLSGKRLHNCGKSSVLPWKLTISSGPWLQ